jgi:hypothetical protein
MIYGNALSWEGKAPPLLAALRSDQHLYQEALETFRKIKYFELAFDGAPMLDTAMESIKKLEIK